MIALTTLWFLCAATLLTTGLAVGILTKSYGEFSLPDFLFLGFGSLAVLLPVLSFFMAINLWVWLTIVSFLIVFFVFKKAIITKVIHVLLADFPKKKYFWLVTASIVIILAYCASVPITYYDTALYHTQNIKWLQQYAVIPGLGNLHGRFAFNSHFFLLEALFSQPVASTIIYPVNTVMLLALTAKLVFLAKKYWLNGNMFKSILYASIAFFALLVYPFILNTPAPDIINAVWVLFTLIYFIENVVKSNRTFYLFLTLLLAVAITIKLSSIWLALLLPVSIFINRNSWMEISKSAKFLMTVLAIVVMASFVGRNAIQSGYLIYPLAGLDVLEVDWKMPKEMLDFDRTNIASWAKVRHQDPFLTAKMPVSDWVPIWWQGISAFFKALLISAVLGLILLPKFFDKIGWGMLFVIIANLVFWFAMAPDPRFVHGFLFFLAAVLLAGIGSFLLNHLEITKKIVTFAFISAIVFAPIVSAASLEKPTKANFTSRLLFPAAYPTAPMLQQSTNFTYWVPVNKERCYNQELPCVSNQKFEILLRGNDLSKGFKIIGPKSPLQ